MRYAWILALAASAWGQRVDLSSLDRLASRAGESVNVDLDSDRLKLATMFLSGDEGAKTTRSLVSGLKGIYVRTFEFNKSGEYTRSDLEPIRAQLKGPNWSRLVDVKEKDESAEVWFFTEGGKLSGLLILAAEARELVAVNIVGPIDPATLAGLSGKMGLPSIDSNLLKSVKPPAEAPKRDDD